MTCQRIMVAVLVGLCLGVGLAAVPGHEFFRFVGTVTRVDDTHEHLWLTFERQDEEVTLRIWVPESTTITHDDETVVRTDLKAGLYVVVEATGDAEDDLQALEIRIVPPPES